MSSTLPRTFLLDPQGLARRRWLAEVGDPSARTALEGIRERAETALSQEPVSVMDKAKVPPSGDKHDYMSLGSYWWPNPDTTDGLPYTRKDG